MHKKEKKVENNNCYKSSLIIYLMSRCIKGDYRCRDCDFRESCNEERVMIDSSIILSILKNEPLGIKCEEKLKHIKKYGQGFITHISLAEIYEETLNFIEEQIENEGLNSFNIPSKAESYKGHLILEIINSLKEILKGLKTAELDGIALSSVNKLFSESRLKMLNRDRLILGTAESHLHTHFIFIDNAIKNDEETIRRIDFKIKLELMKN